MSTLSGLSCTAFFVLSALLLICPYTNGVEHRQGFDKECDFSSLHCDRDLGLFCNMTTKKCTCIGVTVFDANLNYTMVWSSSKGKCVGVEGSVCIGTSDDTVLSYGQKKVECETKLSCVQIEKFTQSVGKCSTTTSGVIGLLPSVIMSLVLPVAYFLY